MVTVIRARRPRAPGYGFVAEDEGEGLLAWDWAEERLQQARRYWLATASGDGRPHLMVVWAVWTRAGLFFSTGDRSRKGRNLEARPECSISTEDGAEAVIVEGRAERVDDEDLRREVMEIYADKYGEGVPDGSPLFRIVPRRAFGFIEAGGRFTKTATCWELEDTSPCR